MAMTAVIPLVLVWLAVLIPQAVRTHRQHRREFVESFSAQMEALRPGSLPSSATASPKTTVPAPPQLLLARVPSTMTRRRRTLFAGLVLSVLVSFLPAVLVPEKLTLAIHLVAVNCFLGYVGLLVRWRDARAAAAAAASSNAPVSIATEDGRFLLASGVRAAFPAA